MEGAAFALDIPLGQLPATVDTDPAWLNLDKREVPRESDTEDALSRLPIVTHRPTDNTPKTDRVRLTLVSITPLSLIHPLMAAPFLSLANVWHLPNAKAQAIEIAQRVEPFIQLIRVCTVAPPRSINALTRIYTADSTLDQWKETRTCLIPTLTPPPIQQAFRHPSRAYPLPAAPALSRMPTKMHVTPAER